MAHDGSVELGPLIFFLDSIRARWKGAQCVDLILGFLELVENPPENKNVQNYELHQPGMTSAWPITSRM